MRRRVLLIASWIAATTFGGAAPAVATDVTFEKWTASCAQPESQSDCRIFTEAPASGADAVRVTVMREAAKDAVARLIVTLLAPASAAPRPRLAITLDGGPPVRLASGSDLSSGPGSDARSVDIRLSDAATKRLLPFLRRGRTLDVMVTGEGGEQVSSALPIAGFGPAVSFIDMRQGRADRQDALSAVIGGQTPAARAGRIRDVSRDAAPEPLRKTMIDRDCPVWDQNEGNPSFLAEQSFAAELGGGRTLWAIVCASGSYNADFAMFVEDPSKAANRFEPLLFANFVESIGWTGVDTLANAEYDPETKQLTAFDKGRGAGDCGTYGIWEWVGAAFRMIEYRSKEECDGVGDKAKFPIVFRGER
jgi:invasion protein IalB